MTNPIELESQRFRRRLEMLGLNPQEVELAVHVFRKEALGAEFFTTEELWIRDRAWQLWEVFSHQQGVAA